MANKRLQEWGPIQTLHGIFHRYTAEGWYTAAFLSIMGVAVGVLALGISAFSCPALNSVTTLKSYFNSVCLLAMNLLPSLLLIWIGYCLFRRTWAAYLVSAIPTLGIALVNYYKIRLRNEPLYPSDLVLARSANGVLEHYAIEFTRTTAVAVICFSLGLLLSIFLCKKKGPKKASRRMTGVILCAGIAFALSQSYKNETLWSTVRYKGNYNIYDQSQVCVVHGSVYSFLYYVRDVFQKEPESFDKKEVQKKFSKYKDSDIPEEKKVNVIGVMLEAFTDLTDFPEVAGLPGVMELYQPLHELESRPVHGNIFSDVFAGGTFLTEVQSLTGAHQPAISSSKLQSDTDSYVWYLRKQGYQTIFTHPYLDFMYNRKNIMPRLGFESARFYEDTVQNKMSAGEAFYYSDKALFELLLDEAQERSAQHEQRPVFSFAVSLQNHGGYGETSLLREEVFPEKESGLSTSSWAILNNYLAGISDTIQCVVEFTNNLENCEEPYVVYLFGDHKPWLGNANSVYNELGVNLDTATLEGVYNYYSTPYLIWANSAAKETLQNEFCGEGGDFSPCFLMQELFARCGWEGPGFMKLSQKVRTEMPMVSQRGVLLVDGTLTKQLSPAAYELYQDYINIQYYRRLYGLEE